MNIFCCGNAAFNAQGTKPHVTRGFCGRNPRRRSIAVLGIRSAFWLVRCRLISYILQRWLQQSSSVIEWSSRGVSARPPSSPSPDSTFYHIRPWMIWTLTGTQSCRLHCSLIGCIVSMLWWQQGVCIVGSDTAAWFVNSLPPCCLTADKASA